MKTEKNQDMPEIGIHVTCYAYADRNNKFSLWIDATLPTKKIQAKIANAIEKSAIEDAGVYTINRFNGFGKKHLSCKTMTEIHEMALWIQKLGDLATKVLEKKNWDLGEAVKTCSLGYLGRYESLEEFGELYMPKYHDIPEDLAEYIDYSYWVNRMEAKDELFFICEEMDKIHFFKMNFYKEVTTFSDYKR